MILPERERLIILVANDTPHTHRRLSDDECFTRREHCRINLSAAHEDVVTPASRYHLHVPVGADKHTVISRDIWVIKHDVHVRPPPNMDFSIKKAMADLTPLGPIDPPGIGDGHASYLMILTERLYLKMVNMFNG